MAAFTTLHQGCLTKLVPSSEKVSGFRTYQDLDLDLMIGIKDKRVPKLFVVVPVNLQALIERNVEYLNSRIA